jgi:hypothetical protein
MIRLTPLQTYLVKSQNERIAYELALGTYDILNNGEIVPLATSEASQEEFNRTSSLVSSYGPKILTKKRDGVLGPITINGDQRIKDYIEQNYDLLVMTEKLATDLIVKGSAVLAIGVNANGEEKIYRIGGFVSRIYSETNLDDPIGIIAIEQLDDLVTYNVRIFTKNQVLVWERVRAVQGLNWNRPQKVYEENVEYIAVYMDYNSDPFGMSIGEMEQIVGILRSLLAIDMRLNRSSELFAYPRVILTGQINTSAENSAADVIVLNEGGTLNYLLPPDYAHLLAQKKDALEQLSELTTLPTGFLSKAQGNFPSGSAVTESNQAYNTSIARYARIMSKGMTDIFYEFLRYKGFNVEGFSITITPNLITSIDADIANSIGLLKENLLTVEYVVSLIRRKFNDIDDAISLEIIERYQSANRILQPEDILAEL